MDKKVCLVAVDVRSTHNVGSFFRTCDGLGADLCLVGGTPRPAHGNDPRLPHVVAKATKDISKTALGAEAAVDWRYFEEFSQAVNWLKENGYTVTALEQTDTSKDIAALRAGSKTALVVGREVEGLSDSELALCDGAYEISMKGVKESFNVSVAAGIALYQLLAQKML